MFEVRDCPKLRTSWHNMSKIVNKCCGAERSRNIRRTQERITISKVRMHCTEDDAWSVFNGNVYNITPYLAVHPGGKEILMRAVGDDGTKLFNQYHSWINVDNILINYKIGKLENKKKGKSIRKKNFGSAGLAPPMSTLSVGNANGIQSHVVSTRKLNHNTFLIRFRFGKKKSKTVVIPLGNHMKMRTLISGGQLSIREYTPIGPYHQEKTEYADFLIKVYPHGYMTSYLSKLKAGDATISFLGPLGEYNTRELRKIRRLGIIAAGSGISAFIRIIQNWIVQTKKKKCKRKSIRLLRTIF